MAILDGGMGRESIACSQRLPTPLCSSRVMQNTPNLMRAVHDDVFSAGSIGRSATKRKAGQGGYRKLSALWLDFDIKPDHHLTAIAHKRTE
ncbi:hypothetical protein [Lentibacter sp. XHP0401]|uniref:hypothetical protein n=1 Tax=Lentibacter sp. XHP0401 TaxID=2984334 RepID=UPI0021E87E89|nr:hypothetical protein [Lentibacter sp. XHP0401]MCV2894328.1 hypothetical protein [Lentibacter sp. XHP0401]